MANRFFGDVRPAQRKKDACDCPLMPLPVRRNYSAAESCRNRLRGMYGLRPVRVSLSARPTEAQRPAAQTQESFLPQL